MRFRTPRDRPHEDRPLRHGHGQTGSILIALHALPDVDVDAVMAEVEVLLRKALSAWWDERGHELLERVPEVA